MSNIKNIVSALTMDSKKVKLSAMMIETPVSVINAEIFASKVDFFNIGINNLTQYILVADRGNKKIGNLYTPYNPAVLKSIQYVINAGHKYNIEVGMCGDLASDENAIQILLGMGLDEFSIPTGEIANVKYIVRSSLYQEAKEMADELLRIARVSQVDEKIMRKNSN